MTMQSSIAAARISGPLPQPEGTMVFEFRFSADDPTFAGHFPTRPLLPGVYQIEVARAAAQWAISSLLAVREISRAKFLRPILPGEIVRLDLKLSEADGTIRARANFSVSGTRAGEMHLELRRRPPR